MQIRNYESRDLEALKAMHASQGVDYEFPNLERPEFFSKLVVENSEGRPVMASIAKKASEVHFLADRSYSMPAVRWELLLWLHREAVSDITRQGVYDAFCFMRDTPKLNRFSSRLQSLGWSRQNLNCLWFERKVPNG